MPRRPKPTLLKLVSGSRDRRLPLLRRGEPVPRGHLHHPPPLFEGHEELLAIWQSVLERAPYGLLKRLDSELLEGWCIAYYLRARALRKWTDGDEQLLIRTPNASIQQSPFVGIINRQTVIMKALAAEMGFSPAARTRVSIDHQEEDGFEDLLGPIA